MFNQNAGPGYPGQGYYQGGYPYPPNQGYPPPQGYPQNPYPPPYASGDPPGPGFAPPPGSAPYGQPSFVPPPTGPMYGSHGDEDGEVKGFDFSEKSIRNGFIRKVYSILMCQLAVTVAMISLFIFHENTRLYVRRHQELFWIAFVATIVLIICMACCSSVRRKAPMNFIFLSLFTVAESFLLATAASTYARDEVFLAAVITTVVCLGLTLFAFQTKIDFTGMGTVLFVAVLILMLFGILTAIMGRDKIVAIVYSSIAAFIFSMYLIYDTQLMLGGKHKYSISPEEYIFAALNLYLDIVQIFMHILAIIGNSRD